MMEIGELVVIILTITLSISVSCIVSSAELQTHVPITKQTSDPQRDVTDLYPLFDDVTTRTQNEFASPFGDDFTKEHSSADTTTTLKPLFKSQNVKENFTLRTTLSTVSNEEVRTRTKDTTPLPNFTKFSHQTRTNVYYNSTTSPSKPFTAISGEKEQLSHIAKTVPSKEGESGASEKSSSSTLTETVTESVRTVSHSGETLNTLDKTTIVNTLSGPLESETQLSSSSSSPSSPDVLSTTLSLTSLSSSKSTLETFSTSKSLPIPSVNTAGKGNEEGIRPISTSTSASTSPSFTGSIAYKEVASKSSDPKYRKVGGHVIHGKEEGNIEEEDMMGDISDGERSPLETTINHAALWITIAFVIILLVYITVLIVYNAKRKDWHESLPSYEQFIEESGEDEPSEQSLLEKMMRRIRGEAERDEGYPLTF